MQTRNRFFDDLAKVANSAAGTFAGLKDEIEAMVRQRVESFLGDMQLVSREEFDAVKAMAAKARDDIGAGKLHPFTGPINKQDGSPWLKAGEIASDGHHSLEDDDS